PGQQLGELVVSRAVAADALQIGVDERAAVRRVDAAVYLDTVGARSRRAPAGIRDHEPDLIVLEDVVADAAERVRTADRFLELADPLCARSRCCRAGAGREQRDERRGDQHANHSATSAASWMRPFDSSLAACSWTCVACSCTRMRKRGTPSTAPAVCSITRSVTMRLDGSRMPKR